VSWPALFATPKKDAYLKSKRLEWLSAFASGFVVVPVSPAIAHRAAEYTFDHRDPCDRHILATAHILKLPLVTIDVSLTECARSIGVSVLW
jgi:PIN domain nuclease of toxin-antitoxin system